MNTPETVALLKLSRDEYIGVGKAIKPLEAEMGTGAYTRPTSRVSGLKRWLLGLVNG